MEDARSAPVTQPGENVRRIELTLRKPQLALYGRIKPTLVIGERGQPTQWGHGTWQVPADRSATIGVYLFNRMWRFGQAEATIDADDASAWDYRAPRLPFLRGKLTRRHG
jgi:hypothetical protein